MIKNIVLTTGLLSGLLCNIAQAIDGNIKFTGSIVATTCQIGNGAKSDLLVVPMGIQSANKMKSRNVGGAMPFKIELSDCDKAITNAKVFFQGAADSKDNNLLALSSDNPATGVAIGIYESDGTTQIPMNNRSKEEKVTETKATLNFIAKYVATGDEVGAGSADAEVDFTVEYS